MTCYFRHLNGIFTKADITVTKENRRELDKIIRDIVGGDADCPVVWRKIKKRLVEDEAGFVCELKAAWLNRTSKA